MVTTFVQQGACLERICHLAAARPLSAQCWRQSPASRARSAPPLLFLGRAPPIGGERNASRAPLPPLSALRSVRTSRGERRLTGASRASAVRARLRVVWEGGASTSRFIAKSCFGDRHANRSRLESRHPYCHEPLTLRRSLLKDARAVQDPANADADSPADCPHWWHGWRQDHGRRLATPRAGEPGRRCARGAVPIKWAAR